MCTKEVTFDIPVNVNDIVVNGLIESDSNAKILLEVKVSIRLILMEVFLTYKKI